MFEKLKNKLKNFTSYLLGYDKIYKEVEDKLKQAKDDKERITILEEGLELSKEAIQRLAGENSDLREENARLKEQLKEHEELESVFSSGSSVSSSEGIDAEVDRKIRELESLLLNTKKSTAPIRKEIKLWKRIKKLKFLNYQKDQKIKELGKKQNKNDLSEITNKVDKMITHNQVLIENIRKS